MSTVLITDTMDETAVTRDEHGWLAMRSAKLLNISGGPSAVVYNGIQDALLTSNNYNFGQAHPTMTALYCSKVSAKAIDVDKIEIVCEYRPYPMLFVASTTQTGLLSMGSSIQGTQTNIDVTGANMVVQPPTGKTGAQSGTANVDAPVTVLQFKRKEPSLPSAAVQSMVNTL